MMAEVEDAFWVALFSVATILIISLPFVAIILWTNWHPIIVFFSETFLGFIGMIVFSYFLLNEVEKQIQ